MSKRKGFGSGFILPNKQRVDTSIDLECRVCKKKVKRYSIYSHLKSKYHNQSIDIDRDNPKYWNKKYCFQL